jgi:hypothetical protein
MTISRKLKDFATVMRQIVESLNQTIACISRMTLSGD